MAPGLTDHVWSIADVVRLLEEVEAPQPGCLAKLRHYPQAACRLSRGHLHILARISSVTHHERTRIEGPLGRISSEKAIPSKVSESERD